MDCTQAGAKAEGQHPPGSAWSQPTAPPPCRERPASPSLRRSTSDPAYLSHFNITSVKSTTLPAGVAAHVPVWRKGSSSIAENSCSCSCSCSCASQDRDHCPRCWCNNAQKEVNGEECRSGDSSFPVEVYNAIKCHPSLSPFSKKETASSTPGRANRRIA
jgi:hypothetical protein